MTPISRMVKSKVKDKKYNEVCSAVNCTNARHKETWSKHGSVSFHTFPRDEERCRIWLQHSRRQDLIVVPPEEIIRKRVVMCSEHFEDSQFNAPKELCGHKRRLVWNAVPTIFKVANQQSSATPNTSIPSPEKPPKKRKLFEDGAKTIEAKNTHCAWCSAANCTNSKNKRPDLAFFRFPQDRARCKKWAVAIGRADLEEMCPEHLQRSNVLCEKHFEPDCFRKTKRKLLTKDALPTLFFNTSPPHKKSCSFLKQGGGDGRSSTCNSATSELSNMVSDCIDTCPAPQTAEIKTSLGMVSDCTDIGPAPQTAEIKTSLGMVSDCTDIGPEPQTAEIKTSLGMVSDCTNIGPEPQTLPTKGSFGMESDCMDTCPEPLTIGTKGSFGMASDCIDTILEIPNIGASSEPCRGTSNCTDSRLELQKMRISTEGLEGKLLNLRKNLFRLKDELKIKKSKDNRIQKVSLELEILIAYIKDMEGDVRDMMAFFDSFIKKEDENSPQSADSNTALSAFSDCNSEDQNIPGKQYDAADGDYDNFLVRHIKEEIDSNTVDENMTFQLVSASTGVDSYDDIPNEVVNEKMTIQRVSESDANNGMDICDAFDSNAVDEKMTINRVFGNMDRYDNSDSDVTDRKMLILRESVSTPTGVGRYDNFPCDTIDEKETATGVDASDQDMPVEDMLSGAFNDVNCSDNSVVSVDLGTQKKFEIHPFRDPDRDKEKYSQFIENLGSKHFSLENVRREKGCFTNFEPNANNKPSELEISKSSLCPDAAPTIEDCGEGCADSATDVGIKSPTVKDEAPCQDYSSTVTQAVQTEEDDDCERLSGTDNCDSKLDDTNVARNLSWKPSMKPVKEVRFKFIALRSQLAEPVHVSQNLWQYQFKCGICCKQFANMNDYCAHMVVHRIKKQNSNTCEICGASFHLRKKLLQHKKLHATDKFTCTICFRQYATKVGRDKHMAMHRGRAYGCSSCDMVFTKLKDLQVHKRECHNQVRAKCEICDKQFHSKFQHDRHVFMHRGKDFGCDLCEGVFKTVKSLKEHRKAFHQDFMFPCSVCSKKFLFARERDEHMNQHIGVRPYECSLCNKACFSRFGLYMHTKLMHNDTQSRLTCKICNMKFKSISARDTHYHSHSSEDLRKHKINLDTRVCEICGFVTRRKYLKQHMISEHSTSKNTTKSVRAKTMFTLRCMRVPKDQKESSGPHRCEVCQKVYKTLAILKQHMVSHSTSFQCNICGKGFCSKSNLDSHVNSHTGERPFKCNICHKKYGAKAALADHLKFHRKEIVCKTCDMCFTNSSSLHRHIKAVHQRIKDYKCEFCEKFFSTKSIRDNHMNIHTGAKPYVCDRCGTPFSDRGTLAKHIKSKHQEKSS